MLKEVLCRWSLLGILCETDLDEISHAVGPSFGVKFWWGHSQDHVTNLSLRQIKIGRLSIGKL